MGEKEGQVDQTGLQWLVRWPRMPGWSEKDDQELRWNQALSLCTEVWGLGEDEAADLIAREARNCPLVKEAAWLVPLIEDAQRTGDKDDWGRVLLEWPDCGEEHDKGSMTAYPMHASHLFLKSVGTSLIDPEGNVNEEIELVRRAAQLGHPLATVKYPVWIASEMVDIRDSDDEDFDQDAHDDEMSRLQPACTVLQRTFETYPACRADAMVAASAIFHDTNIDSEWLSFYGNDSDSDGDNDRHDRHVYRERVKKIALGSIVEVHFLIKCDMPQILGWSWDQIPEVACTLLRAFSVFERDDARSLVFKLCDSALRSRVGEQLLLRFVDGIKACPEALDWFLSPFELVPYWMVSTIAEKEGRRVWGLMRAFLDQQREQVVAWCLCAKRLRVNKDVRRMIAMMLWNDRLNLSDDVGSILEPTTWKQAPPPTKKLKK